MASAGDWRSGAARAGAVVLGVAAGDFLCAQIGYGVILRPGGIAVVWPGAGFVLAALILSGRRRWPAVIAGAALGGALADLQHGSALGFSMAAAAANCLESLVAAWLVTSVVGDRVRLHSLREVVALLVGAAVVSNAVTALVGAAVMTRGGIDFWRAWLVWWTGDGMGMLIVAPAILAWVDFARSRRRLSRAAMLEAAAVLVAIAVLAFVALGGEPAPVGWARVVPYLVFPPLLWIAARFGPWGATTGTIILAAFTEWGAAHGVGPFGVEAGPPLTRVHAIYAYLALASLSSLIPAAIMRGRQEAEAELRHSEHRFRQIAEHIQEAFFTLDLETGQPVYVSPTWGEIWGRPLEEGRDAGVWFEAVHPDDRDAVRESQNAVRRGEASTVTFRLLRPDGTIRWVRGRGFPVRDDRGKVYRLVGLAEDVTTEHELQEELQQSHKLLDQTGELAKIGGWQFDVQTQHLRWTEEVFRIHEIESGVQPAVDQAIEFYAPEARPVIAAAVEAAIADGTPYDLELPMVTASGRRIWVRTLGTADRVGGRTVRVHGVFQDITERREAEVLQRLQSAALEATANAIVITDPTGTIEWVNPAFAALTGYAPEEAIGRNPRDLVRSGKHEPDFYRGMWETITRGRTWQGQVINRRKDGSVYTEDMGITPIMDGDVVTHFVAVKSDVTERLKLEAQLRQSQKMETVGQLASGIAHDFNNLLTVINGMGELVLAELPADHSLHGDVVEMVRAGERAAELTRQLLAFSRQQILQPKLINLNATLSAAEPLLRRVLAADIELLVVPAPDLGNTMADPGQLEQVLLNLAVNARDAMPQGGRLTLETRNVEIDESYARQSMVAVPPGPYVQLTVRDTGVGMDESTRSRVFEPFFTTKPKGQGTGLGLSTVYGIVKQSQGFIFVYSEPGQGTSFRVYLPRVMVGGAPESGTSRETARLTGTETIVVVDDAPEVRALVQRLLESGGYTVLTAASGAEALDLLDREGVTAQLVITDVVMPGMGGRQVVARLARSHPGVRVLYMSGHTDDTVVRHGISQAEVSLLEKPFTKDSLLRRVREVLDAK